jgi:hypothetical protein
MEKAKILFLLMIFFFSFSKTEATSNNYNNISARVGFSTHIIYEDFILYDILFVQQLTSFGSQVSPSDFKIHLHLQAGQLTAAGEKGLLTSLGPAIAWKKPANRFSISAGTNLAYVSNFHFGNAHIGGPFQFFSHILVEYNFIQWLGISYNFQHLSNAEIYYHNPGINLHSFGLVLYF